MGLLSRMRRLRPSPAQQGKQAQQYVAGCGISRPFEASKFLDLLLQDAQRWRATDIHLIPVEDRMQIRFRVDGGLRDFLSLEAKQGKSIIQRIKVVAGMDFLNYWEPQDGAARQTINQEEVAFRASTMPVKTAIESGERAILRLYWKRDFSLENLGFDPATLASWRRLL